MGSVLDQIVRWERSGGIWRVTARSAEAVSVSLVSCDGGTEMSRLSGPAAELDAFLAGRSSSEDGARM